MRFASANKALQHLANITGKRIKIAISATELREEADYDEVLLTWRRTTRNPMKKTDDLEQLLKVIGFADIKKLIDKNKYHDVAELIYEWVQDKRRDDWKESLIQDMERRGLVGKVGE